MTRTRDEKIGLLLQGIHFVAGVILPILVLAAFLPSNISNPEFQVIGICLIIIAFSNLLYIVASRYMNR